MTSSREIHLKRYPTGLPTPADFELVEIDLPSIGQGEVLIKNLWMSVDPYMRGRMRPGESYVGAFQIGSPLEGGAIGQVIESMNPAFPAGTCVAHFQGWREFFVSTGEGLNQVDPSLAPLQTYLGTLGMPGMTAYIGLLKIGEAQQGEIVFVSAASGAVGAVVCQIARARGCRVVGSAGSDAKVAWLLEEAGVDHAINYKKVDDLKAELARACPAGIDLYFENVGGEHLEAVLDLMNDFGRIVACGMISVYNEPAPPPGPGNLVQIIVKRLRLQGFIVSDHMDAQPEFLRQMAEWIAAGQIKWHETVLEGIDRAPDAFIGLFKGENFGKMLVKLEEFEE